MVVILALMLTTLALSGTHPPVVVDGEARTLERYLNLDREQRNLAPLQTDERLHALALQWALRMANEHFFAHADAEGRGLVDRLHDAGYEYHYAAENIALDSDAQAANAGLMHSPGHAANILSLHARKVGVAAVNIAPNETIFVEDFSD